MTIRFSSNLFGKAAAFLLAGAALSGSAAVSTVSVQDDVFVPSTSNIHAGDSVVWHWDGTEHNVTSTSNPQAWKASATQTSTTFTFTNTFASAGKFPYECTVHAAEGMLATINVAAAPIPPTISITNPVSGALLAAPANVTIGTTITDAGGTVTNVEFLVGSTVLRNITSAPFTAATNGLPSGNYILSAIATDNNGLTATNMVNIRVFAPASLGNSLKSSPTAFQFSYSATPGVSYVVHQSTNLTTWVSLATNVATANPASFSDNNATNNPSYYRVGGPSNP